MKELTEVWTYDDTSRHHSGTLLHYLSRHPTYVRFLLVFYWLKSTNITCEQILPNNFFFFLFQLGDIPVGPDRSTSQELRVGTSQPNDGLTW